MNKENVSLWLEALYSGQYAQGTGRLRYENEFCCLGVACDVYQQHVGDLVVNTNDISSTGYDSQYYDLPYKVAEWLGIDQIGGFALQLQGLNDVEKYTFEEIASVIEETASHE